MATVYTFQCPQCGREGCNVWTRDGTRWYFLPHQVSRPSWNGSAWVYRECLASNAHVPLLIANHMRQVYRVASNALRRWYEGRSGERQLGVVLGIAPG